MNKLSKALGRWLFQPYQCSVCRLKLNIHDGLILDSKDNNKVMHKGCKNATIRNYKNTV